MALMMTMILIDLMIMMDIDHYLLDKTENWTLGSMAVLSLKNMIFENEIEIENHFFWLSQRCFLSASRSLSLLAESGCGYCKHRKISVRLSTI